MAEFTRRLADRLAGLRAARGLTLDQLAGLSGVSRAALSRMENAEVSPSAEALARLAAAHEMSLSQLLAAVEDGFAGLVRRDAQPVVRDRDTGVAHRLASPGAAGLAAELHDCKMPAGTGWRFVAAAGQELHLLLLSGRLTVHVGGADHALEPGDVLRHRVDGPPELSTPPGQGAKFLICAVAP